MEKYHLPILDYKYDALEPFIDAKTMEIHYTKHHQNYVNNLNNSLSQFPNLTKEFGKDLKKLLNNLSLLPEKIRKSVQNNGGGHFNHSFFWKILKKENYDKNNLSPELQESIKRDFLNLENFKNKFSEEAKNLFGSGWAWLILDFQKKLKIISTQNQDTVINKGFPLLGIDVWEHAYYLSYQNNRLDYIEAFFNIINWEQVSNNLKHSLEELNK
jgi:Fe-Mn family superoxide dismutase